MLSYYDLSDWVVGKPYKEDGERATTTSIHARMSSVGGTNHENLITCITKMQEPCIEDSQLPLLCKKISLLLNMSRGLSLEDLKSYKLTKVHKP